MPNLTISQFFILFISFNIFSLKILSADEHPSARKIGVILALSGPLSTVGKNIQNNILLSKSKNDPNNEVEIIFEDDQFQAKHAVSAAEKLISQDKVSALITFAGGSSFSVSKVAELKKVPLVAITALEEITKSKSYVYTIFMPIKEQIRILSEKAKSAGFKRLAMITTEHEAMNDFRTKFLEQNKAEIVFDEQIIPGDLNLNTIVTRVNSKKPDAVILFLLPPQLSVFSRQLRAQAFKGQFIGGPPMFNPPEIAAAAGALDGAWMPSPKSDKLQGLKEEYQEKFHEPLISEGVYGYEAIKLLIEASKTGDVNKYLSHLEMFEGLVGTYPKSKENVFSVPTEISVIQADATLLPLK